MEQITFDLGEFVVVEKHQDCPYGGKLLKCRAPSNESAHLWCNGREWEMQKSAGDDKRNRTWVRKACKYSAMIKYG